MVVLHTAKGYRELEEEMAGIVAVRAAASGLARLLHDWYEELLDTDPGSAILIARKVSSLCRTVELYADANLWAQRAVAASQVLATLVEPDSSGVDEQSFDDDDELLSPTTGYWNEEGEDIIVPFVASTEQW